MTKLSGEGMSKARTGQKLGLSWQTVSHVVKVAETFSKEMESATPVNTQTVRKWNSFTT